MKKHLMIMAMTGLALIGLAVIYSFTQYALGGGLFYAGIISIAMSIFALAIILYFIGFGVYYFYKQYRLQ